MCSGRLHFLCVRFLVVHATLANRHLRQLTHRPRFCSNEATDGLCSQCYKVKMSALLLKAEQPSSVVAAQPPLAEAPSADPLPIAPKPAPSPALTGTSTSATHARLPPDDDPAETATKKKNRCYTCKKKVGLLGFECKCGRLLCASHRQAEEHDCCYDYRAEGKKAIEVANPRVQFAKITDV